MKKVLCSFLIALSLCFTFALVGCGGGDSSAYDFTQVEEDIEPKILSEIENYKGDSASYAVDFIEGDTVLTIKVYNHEDEFEGAEIAEYVESAIGLYLAGKEDQFTYSVARENIETSVIATITYIG